MRYIPTIEPCRIELQLIVLYQDFNKDLSTIDVFSSHFISLKLLTPALKSVRSVFGFLIAWAFHIGDENHLCHRPQCWYIHPHLEPLFVLI